jgi:hypothetical protein
LFGTSWLICILVAAQDASAGSLAKNCHKSLLGKISGLLI